MRDRNHVERRRGTRSGRTPAAAPRPIDSRYLTPREEIARAFAGAPRIDFKQFREDIDAYVDPTPREWDF